MILTKECEHFKTVKGQKTNIQVNSTTESPGPLDLVLGHLEIKDTGLAGHCTLELSFSPALNLHVYMHVISPNSNYSLVGCNSTYSKLNRK